VAKPAPCRRSATRRASADALFQLRYDAPGAPALARRVADLLQGAGFAPQLSPEGGLDHGIWTPLRSLRPQADIPVVPVAGYSVSILKV